MELKTPPQCEGGNSVMLLRSAGDCSTHSGQQYCICLVGLKLRKRFFWYDEFHARNITSTDEQSNNTNNNSTNFEDHSCHSSNRRSFKYHSMNSSSSPYACPSNQGDSYATKQYVETDRGMSYAHMSYKIVA